MNREQKSAAIAEIAAQIEESQAIFAVDYRGISVPQVAELRGRLREADASFKVVKNSLTERAADASGAEALKELLTGPTALTFVRGDAATAAKAIADYGRATQLLPFKGGLMEGSPLDVEQIRSLSRLPSRDVLYSQLVGVVSSPVTGLVRTLGALLGGLASALGQVRTKMESGEIPSAAPPEAEPAEPEASEVPGAEEAPAEPEPAAKAEPSEAPAAEEPPAQAETAAEEEPPAQAEPAAEEEPSEAPAAEEPAAEPEAPEQPAAEEGAQAEAAPEDGGADDAGETGAGEDDKQGADGPSGEQSADDTSNKED